MKKLGVVVLLLISFLSLCAFQSTGNFGTVTISAGTATIGKVKVTDGTLTEVLDPCQANTKSPFTTSGTATVLLVTGVSSKKTYICSIVVVASAAQNIAIVEGTGATCGTGTATYPGLSGGTTAATGWNLASGLTFGNGAAFLGQATTNADNVCALLANAVQTNISGTYVTQ